MWAVGITGYNCTIEYIPEPKHVLADLLSRMSKRPADEKPQEEEKRTKEITDNLFEIGVINSNEFTPKEFASYER